MDLYAQNLLDRYKHPYYKDKAFSPTLSHAEINHSCGDAVTVQLEIQDGLITQYGFTGQGCAISMASADILGDLVSGEPTQHARELSKDALYEALGIEISVRRSKCALLPLLALHNALLKSEGKPLQSWMDYHLTD